MDYKQFKKELFEEMRAILKPHGFAKYGHRFRCAQENGIACMVEVQSHRFGDSLTINVFFGVLPVPVTAESWKDFRWNAQWEGHLGKDLADGWSHQHWVEPYDEDDPRVVDGCITMRWKQMDGPWQEMKIPVPTPEQAKAQVCGLLRDKLLPLFESLKTPEDYVHFGENAEVTGWHCRLYTPTVYRFYAQVVDAAELLPGIDEKIRFHTKIRDKDRRKLVKLQEEIAQSRRKKPSKGQLIVLNNYELFIRQREQLLAEFEELRQDIITISAQKE